MTTDPRVDAYIARQADFARPILEAIRARVHAACPEAEEAIKWSMPAFLYRGKILAVMAGFKAHATLALWERGKGEGTGEGAAPPAGGETAMGQFGRLRSVADLPPEPDLSARLREAMAHIAAGARTRALPATDKGPPPVPPQDLIEALAQVAGARAGFEALPPGARREYVAWVLEAKRADTRARRIATTAEQAAQGRKLHWKYNAC